MTHERNERNTRCRTERAKTGLVIQGDVRCPDLIPVILRKMGEQFDHVILATWPDDVRKVRGLPCDVVVCDKPANSGITYRNYQRVSAAMGLRRAEELGCKFALKWRTDLVAANWSTSRMMELVTHSVPLPWRSRLLMSAFRVNSVEPDWFSSLPDLYSFGDVKLLQLLWSTEKIDFSLNFNIPYAMLSIPGIVVDGDRRITMEGYDITNEYDAHVELWAQLKAKMENELGREFRHSEWVRDYIVPLEHEELQICWLKPGSRREFRAIRKGNYIRWLREREWRRGRFRPPMQFRDRLRQSHWAAFWDMITRVANERTEKILQRIWYRRITTHPHSAEVGRFDRDSIYR